MVKEKNTEIIGKDGIMIPAIFTQGNRQKAVLIAHGICGDKNEWYDTSARIAEKLQENGIACLRIDFRGHGDSAEPLSAFTPQSQLSDMESAYEWLAGKGFTEILPLGISFGGPAAIRLCAQHPETVRTCVLIAPVTDYRRNILEADTDWGKEAFREMPDEKGGVCYRISDGYVMGNDLIREMKTIDIPSVIEDVFRRNRTAAPGEKQMFLLFHGEEDPKVSFSGSRELAEEFPDTVKLTPLPETVHGLTQTGDETFTAPQTLKNLEALIETINENFFGCFADQA